MCGARRLGSEERGEDEAERGGKKGKQALPFASAIGTEGGRAQRRPPLCASACSRPEAPPAANEVESGGDKEGRERESVCVCV